MRRRAQGSLDAAWLLASSEVDDTIGKYLRDVFDDEAIALFSYAHPHFSGIKFCWNVFQLLAMG